MKFRKGQKQHDEAEVKETAAAGENSAAAAESEASETAATATAPEDEAQAEAVPAGDGPAEKIAALEDQLLRLRAEFANYRKRTERERTELATHVKAAVYREILPTLDDFERFFQHVEERRDSLDRDFVQGIEMIHKSLVGVLQRQGVESIQEVGAPFDPNLHEAMLTGPVEDEAQDNTVLQVFEAGYRLGETIIRPARVQVGQFESK